MPLEKTDFRHNIIDLLDRALTGGVVVDSGVAPPPARAAWPSPAPTPAAHQPIADAAAAASLEPAPTLATAAEAAADPA